MAFKIYTKTGDAGKTGLIGGTKVFKNALRIECYGTVDELNSWIGLCADLLADNKNAAMLREIQDRLFTIGAVLAADPGKEIKLDMPGLHDGDVDLLETEIDKMTDELPEMKSFILPGGHVTVSNLHITRCVCRRAERLAVSLQVEENNVHPLVIIYLNRLSDYLFTLARFTAHELNIPDIPWKPRTD